MILEHQMNLVIPDGISKPQLDRINQFLTVLESAAQLFVDKNYQYGDSIKIGGVRGAVYEMSGIYGRLWEMVVRHPSAGAQASKELHTIFLDALNYAGISIMMMEDNNWIGELIKKNGEYR